MSLIDKSRAVSEDWNKGGKDGAWEGSAGHTERILGLAGPED